MRDDKWLFAKLDQIWDKYFSDVPQDNDVRIIWGRRARSRLGSIKQMPINTCSNGSFGRESQITNRIQNSPSSRAQAEGKFEIQNSISTHPETIITINSLFKDPKIPDYVVCGTIAHELSHYAHGFNSPLAQKYATPHAGGVIRHELKRRGLEKIYRAQKKWLKENWRNYLDDNFPVKTSARRRKRVIFRWI